MTSRVIAITGGTGFVGTHLVHSLLQSGNRVRLLARSPEKAANLFGHKVELFKGDIQQPETLIPFLEGATDLFHLASILQEPGTKDQVFWNVHVQGTQNLLEASLQAGIQRFVHCSTIGVLGAPKVLPANEQSPYRTKDIYQITKCEAEKTALRFFKEKNLSGVVVRPAAVYGPGDMRMFKIFRFISQHKFRMIGNGETFIHPVHVEDLVSGMILAAEKKERHAEIYILGGEKAVHLNEFVQTIAKALNTSLKSGHLPFWPIWLAAAICEIVCKPLGIHPPLFRRRVEFFSKSRAFDISKAKRELGYQPQYSLEEGIKQTCEWYQEQGLL